MNNKLLYEYTKNIKVLYVEDDHSVREQTALLLEHCFFNLVVANDGVDGLKKFSKEKDGFDLILTDINMPNMNGITMCKEILYMNPEVEIIFITAHNELEYLKEALEIGASSFVSKPFQKEVLDNAIFKASQVIHDHKFVLSHMDIIEDLNLQLETQNKELEAKNKELEKSIRILDTLVNKDQITHVNDIVEESSLSVNTDDIDLQIQQLVNEDLHELIEIHTEIDTIIIKIINKPENVLESDIVLIITKFDRYASILSYHNFFSKLSREMKGFSLTLHDNEIPSDTVERENIFMLLESFLYVLQKWQLELENGNREMINFFDASIINDMTTIANLWVKSPDEEEDFGEMEFF